MKMFVSKQNKKQSLVHNACQVFIPTLGSHIKTMSSSHDPNNRIILLFDLDCFYAQCERVRLGLDIDCKLALLQWNSVLAVTYPARKFGIKRGDSWEDVAKKSEREC